MADTADDFFDPLTSSHGGRRWERNSWRSRRYGRVVDAAFDAGLALNPSFHRLRARAAVMPVRKVLVTSVDVPARRADLDRVVADLRTSRHDVTVALTPLGDRGKFQNINAGLAEVDVERYDWLVVFDDDVALPPRFLDLFLCAAENFDFRICQPAHRFFSYTSWELTQRVWNSLAHTSNFVECGPITAFHRSVFSSCLPFPDTRWAWGIDVLWSEIARRQGFRIGIVDATPIGHLRDVAVSYSRQAAIAEAQELLTARAVRRDSRELLRTVDVMRRL